MHEVFRNERTVNGVKFETWKAELCNANILEVEAGTTGYKGGDTGHGCRTYLRIKDLASTDLCINGTESEEVTIELGGDTELNTFIQALEFALKVLKEQSEEK